jgi:hypothetical protein
MFRFTEPSSGQFLKTLYWYIQRVRAFAECTRGWFSEPKHVAKLLTLITNICCVTDRINYCITDEL